MNIPAAIAVPVVLVTSIGLVWWREATALPATADYVAFVHDASGSARSGCASIVALVTREMATAEEHQRKIRFVLIGTGGRGSAYEPVAFELPVIEPSVKVIEGETRLLDRRTKFLDRVRDVCSQFETTTVSPVFIAVQRAVEQVRVANGHGRVYVQSDLEENVDRKIRSALNGYSNDLPKPIQNRSTPVHLCGYAETKAYAIINGRRVVMTEPRTSGAALRIESVWKRLFAYPDLVTFQPFCPQS